MVVLPYHIKVTNPSFQACNLKQFKCSPRKECIIFPDINRAELSIRRVPLSILLIFNDGIIEVLT